jgi:hypothetical protein
VDERTADLLKKLQGTFGVNTRGAVHRISHSTAATLQSVNVQDEIARRIADLREWMATRIMPVFLGANGWTLGFLGGLTLRESTLLPVSPTLIASLPAWC